ncbi:MAG: PAS domain S-box protein [Salinivirgaceae bacterium]|jgi:PAS domain S-box-containing protein|nr:PAS domain S-box protein [Salinivirgaceae bacterium]
MIIYLFTFLALNVEIYVFISIILLLIVLLIVLRKVRYYISKYRKVLFLYKNRTNNLRNEILEERQRVDLHREEILAQTEHLQELNVELERLSLVASKTDTAVAIADHKGRFTYVNQGFVDLFGYSLAELIEIIGPDIYSASKKMNIIPMLERAIELKQSFHHTSSVTSKSGESKWVKTNLTPIYDELGKIKQYIMLETDVSELKLINDKLRKLSLVASKTNNSVIIFNDEGNIDWVNNGFHNLYGYSKEEFIEKVGLNIKDFCIADNQGDIIDLIQKQQKPQSYLCKLNDRFGIEKWKQTNIAPIFGDKKVIKNYIVVESDITRIKEAEYKIQEEKEKADQLLLNILPEETAEELKTKGKATPRFYRSVSVLFADIQDFTKLAENLTPEELVHDLQSYFSRFDDAVNRLFVEKIKTMGDAFLCVGGIPMRNKSHPFDTVLVGLELQRIIRDFGKEREESGRRALQLRIGIHSGPVIAGVVGKQKMTYDIWGDTVNIAKRIETACVASMVNVSSTTYEIIKDYFECEHRGKILAKHKGHIDMYFVHKIKSEFSENGDGITPNNYFREMMAQL